MIERLFTSKTRARLLEYFIIKEKKARLREIARDVNISVSAVSRELKNLQSLGLVIDDKGLFKLNRENSLVGDIKNILIKTDSFGAILKKALKDFNIDFIFIFGSFAAGSYSEDSDIDIFIAGDVRLEDIARTIRNLEKRTGREINPVVWPLKDLISKKDSAFIREVAGQDIVLIRGSELELKKIIGKEKD